MTNEEKTKIKETLIETLKEAIEIVSENSSLKLITNLYKQDAITYNEFVTLLNFIQRHKTDFKYD